MPIKIRRVYLDAILERYSKSTKKGKSLILDEFCEVCGYSRKYAIRVLRGQINPRLNRPGPKPKYGATVAYHLRQLWVSMDQLCSKKMVEALPLWLPYYRDCDPRTKALLLEISASMIDRLLKPHRDLVKKGLSHEGPLKL